MFRLERLHADHVAPLLAFELENRAYFALAIPDRGDEYFREFGQRLGGLLAEQDGGVCHFHVVVSGAGEVVGRVNLVDVQDGVAELGYRVGERWGGQGVASWGVGEVCRVARETYALRGLFAGAAVGNVRSRRVLERNGFVVVRVGDGQVRYEVALI
ncbi:GNAT family N-acetyltransferase [Streptomyces acidiscabies]|uniref:GNAT family N-acetyltransferase n=1 Tax=Streptomyces acidiscabies TaxID=42234 RepID=UPI00067E0CA4|nr:GNAT family N-acetyltransferase [Streptomyces acidiscabies]